MNNGLFHILILCFAPGMLLAQPVSLGADEDHWIIPDSGVTIIKAGSAGQQISDTSSNPTPMFKFERGTITAKDVVMQDGIVEFDMLSSGQRAFVYVYFREASARENEVFYIRTHKSNAPDTLQYAPVFQGRSAWQLYHGEEGTASATIPAKKWTPIKLVVSGQTLTVWVGENTEPAMKVTLTRDPIAGSVSLRGNIPPASHADFSAYVRNIRITPMTPLPVETAEGASPTDFITAFGFSTAYESDKQPQSSDSEVYKPAQWSRLNAQPDGRFELLRSLPLPDGVRGWGVTAQTHLYADRATRCQVNFGFSDTLSVWLNGEPITYADASYRYAQNRQEGVMHPDQVITYLPLNEGQNELTVVVADSFGGWGLSARKVDCAGVTSDYPDAEYAMEEDKSQTREDWQQRQKMD